MRWLAFIAVAVGMVAAGLARKLPSTFDNAAHGISAVRVGASSPDGLEHAAAGGARAAASVTRHASDQKILAEAIRKVQVDAWWKEVEVESPIAPLDPLDTVDIIKAIGEMQDRNDGSR
jgi:hypothetical protein